MGMRASGNCRSFSCYTSEGVKVRFDRMLVAVETPSGTTWVPVDTSIPPQEGFLSLDALKKTKFHAVKVDDLSFVLDTEKMYGREGRKLDLQAVQRRFESLYDNPEDLDVAMRDLTGILLESAGDFKVGDPYLEGIGEMWDRYSKDSFILEKIPALLKTRAVNEKFSQPEFLNARIQMCTSISGRVDNPALRNTAILGLLLMPGEPLSAGSAKLASGSVWVEVLSSRELNLGTPQERFDLLMGSLEQKDQLRVCTQLLFRTNNLREYTSQARETFLGMPATRNTLKSLERLGQTDPEWRRTAELVELVLERTHIAGSDWLWQNPIKESLPKVTVTLTQLQSVDAVAAQFPDRNAAVESYLESRRQGEGHEAVMWDMHMSAARQDISPPPKESSGSERARTNLGGPQPSGRLRTTIKTRGYDPALDKDLEPIVPKINGPEDRVIFARIAFRGALERLRQATTDPVELEKIEEMAAVVRAAAPHPDGQKPFYLDGTDWETGVPKRILIARDELSSIAERLGYHNLATSIRKMTQGLWDNDEEDSRFHRKPLDLF